MEPGKARANLTDVAILLKEQLERRVAEDTCTDQDNCKRCRTLPPFRWELPHAGLQKAGD